jgi:hypothetical protein
VLEIHQSYDDRGVLTRVFLRSENGALAIVDDGGALLLPDGALDAVMRRFGAPLYPNERLAGVADLAIAGGGVLRHVRHKGFFDVIARDYLVYIPPGGEPLCALATTVAAALSHLSRGRLRNPPP